MAVDLERLLDGHVACLHHWLADHAGLSGEERADLVLAGYPFVEPWPVQEVEEQHDVNADPREPKVHGLTG